MQNWVAFSGTPTYVSATSFTVSGDQRSVFLESRRLKTTNTGGTVYSTVVSATYATSQTTVVVSNDYGQSLDAGLSAISYGFVETGATSSIPVAVNAGSAASGSQYQMWIDYDGTNLKWSKDSDANSATWPITASNATLAATATLATSATYGLSLSADSGTNKLVCQHDGNTVFYLNNAAEWNIKSDSLTFPNLSGQAGGAALSWNTTTGEIKINTSSERFKTDIRPAWYGLDDVLDLKPVTYAAIEDPDGKRYGGFIAEEVGIDEFVVKDKDGQVLSLQYANMVSLLCKAIQELNAKVEALKNV